MKKTIIVLMMVLLCAVLIISCDGDASGSSTTSTTQSYTVTFDLDGGTGTFAPITVESGKTVNEPTNKPTKTGKIFDHWAAEKDGTTEFDFANSGITEDTTLYAVFRNYRVGDTVSYGTYPGNYAIQSLRNQPVTWKVLAVDATNSKALVISEYILENSVWGSNSYSSSEINSYFMNVTTSGFISTYGLSDVNIEATTIGLLSESVFLLSTSEVRTYFATSSKIANYGSSASAWWLRSYDDDSGSPICVNASGEVVASGSSAHSYGVRPAFWVKFSN